MWKNIHMIDLNSRFVHFRLGSPLRLSFFPIRFLIFQIPCYFLLDMISGLQFKNKLKCVFKKMKVYIGIWFRINLLKKKGEKSALAPRSFWPLWLAIDCDVAKKYDATKRRKKQVLSISTKTSRLSFNPDY